VGVSLLVLPLSVQAQTFFSPSQAELNTFAFVDYWPGNGAALTSTTLVGVDGVEYTFDTGFSTPTPDAFSRSQWTLPFTQNLAGYENVGVAFQVPAGGSANGHSLFAQIGLHYNAGANMVVSGWTAINEADRTNIYLPLGGIPPAQLMSGLTSFDIELRSEDPFEVDMGDRVNAFTAPAPPAFVDGFQINDFEGSDPGTWGPAFQPDHDMHTIVMADATEFNNGVSKGMHALQIARTFTNEGLPGEPSNLSFRWGSQMALNAVGGGGNPVGDYNDNGTVDAADYTRWRDALGTMTMLDNDPIGGEIDNDQYVQWVNNFGMTGGSDPTQANIDAIVDAINDAADNGGLIAFDVSFLNVDNFPNAQPGFLGFEMFITDGSGAFYQPDTTLIGQTSGQGFGFPAIPAVGEFYQGLTLSLPLDIFTDLSENGFGRLGTADLVKNDNFTIGLASNTDGGATFVIDNIRIQNLVMPPGLGLGAAVPEPSAAMLALVTLGLGGTLVRRRTST
jgi:hypothetical protein